MNKPEPVETLSPDVAYRLKLVELKDHFTNEDLSTIYVTTSHRELDSLIGRLMQMCDLIGDLEQRKALKDTIKQICRDWMNDNYESAGYDKFEGICKGVQVVWKEQ